MEDLIPAPGRLPEALRTADAATEGDEDKTVDDAIFEHDAPDNEEDGPPPALAEEAPAPLEPAGEEEDAPGEDGLPLLPTERRPTLQEYQSKWQTKLAEHSREVEGCFSNENLCPKPTHHLWQDCIRLSCSGSISPRRGQLFH